jgi:predicted nucleic acid-binding protein
LIFVGTNILLDLATDNSEWFDWSLEAIETAAADGPLIINMIVYAELSARYQQARDVEELLAVSGVQVADIPRSAAFLAANAFGKYRATGGAKTGVLSDFFIGAHAAALDIPLLTRDIRRYRTYFPELRLIAPQLN